MSKNKGYHIPITGENTPNYDQILIDINDAITLLKAAVQDLNAVPNRKYCNNYKTASDIDRLLARIEE